ncbi:tetratricopeptide repeat protein [Populibacterium corticicola]|uniref:Tetratricopeptide repeat protein n=1 Tax=Populibacterium corticicola TaxID=1812826 RepID=A0ABW5XD28_9MICO
MKLNFPLFDESLNSSHAIVLAQLIGRQRKQDVQELLLRHAATHNPAEGARELGLFYDEHGKNKKAARYYKIAHEAGDRLATAYLGKLYYMWAWGMHEEERLLLAEEYLNEVLDLPSVPATLAHTLWELERYDDAESILHSFAERDRETAECAIFYKVVDTHEAIRLLELHRDRGHLEVLGQLGKLYAKQDRYQEARAALEEAVILGDHSVHGRLAKVLWHFGEEDRAIKQWKKAAKRGDRSARRKLKKIRKSRHA